MQQKEVILIVGPTAAGKTQLAIDIASHFHCPIISADSRQCFREMNIGVAKPSPEQLQRVPHYFINSHSIHDKMSVALFEELALNWAAEIFRTQDRLVMAGGTGLYVKAFCEGLDDIPSVKPSIRESIGQAYREQGLAWLQESVRREDPVFAAGGEMLNPQRLMRALEVVRSTGHSILSFQTGSRRQRPFTIRKYGIEVPRSLLYQRINNRVDAMIHQGLMREVLALYPDRALPALQTVGYTEFFAYLDGDSSSAKAIEEIKTNTRQYAKRQLTWFKRDPEIRWGTAENLEKIIKS